MFTAKAYRGPRGGTELGKSTSQAILNGAFLVRSTSGNIVPGTSSAAPGDVEGISTQAVTAGQALAFVTALIPGVNDIFLADTTNNSSASHNRQRMILTDSVTVNNTGTDSSVGVVEQVGVVGVAADKKILVKVII